MLALQPPYSYLYSEISKPTALNHLPPKAKNPCEAGRQAGLWQSNSAGQFLHLGKPLLRALVTTIAMLQTSSA